jgi:hypothetical protein
VEDPIFISTAIQQARQSLRAIMGRREETAHRVAAKLGITVPVTIGD